MRNRCNAPACTDDAHRRGADLFCRRHWSKLPTDLRERIRWAADGEDEIELRAALAATDDVLS